jgi:predicted metal-binding membrane protein
VVRLLTLRRTPAPGADLSAPHRALILAPLLGAAGLGWLVVARQASGMPAMSGGLVMGMRASGFVAMWTAMMAGMMLPAAAPMILTFAKISAGKRQQGQPWVPAWVFGGAYLVAWTVFGAAAYTAAAGVDRLAGQSMWWRQHAAALTAAVLALAGLYQFSPLKHVCLSRCRTPLGFLLGCWRDGYAGAVSMGLRHGLYCLGCCWPLFLILFPLGVMNTAAMAAVTALVFAEKLLPRGDRIARAAGVALLGSAAVVLLLPRAAMPGM